MIAIGEVARPVRFLNLLFGVWLVAAPWLLNGYTPVARWNDALVGAALVMLSLRRGPVRERHGSWDRYII